MSDGNSKNNDKDGIRVHKLYKVLSIAFTVVVVILVIIFRPTGVPFKVMPFSDIGLLIVFLFVIALFIERTVEVVIKSWRGKGKQALETNYKAVKGKSKTEPKNPDEKIAKESLDKYTAETKTIAILTLLGLGLAVSALGIRALQPLIDPAVFKTLSCTQKAFFYGMDTFVTGALLGGGSLGIHKILDAALSMFDKFKDWMKTRNKGSNDDE